MRDWKINEGGKKTSQEHSDFLKTRKAKKARENHSAKGEGKKGDGCWMGQMLETSGPWVWRKKKKD